MRTTTTAQDVLLAAPSRATHIKVEVYDSASWVDLGALQGTNWVQSVAYSDGVDMQLMEATITCLPRDADAFLSPLVDASVINATNTLLAIGNDVRISAALTTPDTLPESGDYLQVFYGAVDAVSISSKAIKVRCRDQSGALADAFIEDAGNQYGSAAGTKVETVMQAILDDWGGSVKVWSVTGVGGTEFQVADSPLWLVSTYQQRREPVLTALQTLADQIGWRLRYVWQANAAAFKLVFFEPDRTASTADRTIGADDYRTIDLSYDRKSVRNAVDVIYRNKAAGDAVTTVPVTDPTSIAKYGRLWMEIAEEAASQVDTSAEATALANSKLNDLKEPKATVRLTLPYDPFVEVGDLWELEEVPGLADTLRPGASDMKVAVRSLQHTITAAGSTTAATLMGLPASATMRHTQQQAVHPKRLFGSFNMDKDSEVSGNLVPNGDFGQWTQG